MIISENDGVGNVLFALILFIRTFFCYGPEKYAFMSICRASTIRVNGWFGPGPRRILL